MLPNYRGESGQDNFAHAVCGLKNNGTFLDIGCNEPMRWNNTYALEEVGWTGWLVDINPVYGDEIRKVRKSPFICADAATLDYGALVGDRLYIDYLSLDIDENQDRNLATTILGAVFAAGLRFKCATVEHDGYRFGDHPREEIRQVMRDNGYILEHANVEIRKGCGKPFEDWWVR